MMKPFSVVWKKMLGDSLTPVSIYQSLRAKYPGALLLESSDYHTRENSFSFICVSPVAYFKLANQIIESGFYGQSPEFVNASSVDVQKQLIAFLQSFVPELNNEPSPIAGLFGYTCYDAVRYYEDVNIGDGKEPNPIPDIFYQAFGIVIVFDHFQHWLSIGRFTYSGFEGFIPSIDDIFSTIKQKASVLTTFKWLDNEKSNLTDEAYKAIVEEGKRHCRRGDVFQIVLSRLFKSGFTGDDFQLYRALRAINPSPYLFYFDCEGFRLMGSSPEAQMVIADGKATIFPIAGTFKRTGNDELDKEVAQKLADDPKENAEHVMLVDLARNDLSRDADEVAVETFREIQYYSHVIHLVSKVTAKAQKGVNGLTLVAKTFPAGTLSGAPKHMAMQLIDRYEPTPRGFYGGAIGYYGFNGDYNHAILIRSFLSLNNELYYRAGGGVVEKSVPESELQEVNNKLAALRAAIKLAENI